MRYNANAKVYNDTTRGYEPFMGNKKRISRGIARVLAGYDSAYRACRACRQIYGRTEENRNQTAPRSVRHAAGAPPTRRST